MSASCAVGNQAQKIAMFDTIESANRSYTNTLPKIIGKRHCVNELFPWMFIIIMFIIIYQ